ncbi:MAG: glycosyltransferase [Chloroflexi bacterium]|nr:glycosyltransferase [Chloroflexota bacterium]
MRVLMISKACLVGAYQTKLEEIGQCEDVELTVIVPPSWNDPAGIVKLERAHTNGYRLLVDPIRFNGQFHTHYYPRLQQRIAQFKPDIVHIDEEPYNFATWHALRQAKKVGAKTLFFSWQNINRPYPIPFRWMERQVLTQVDFALMGNRDAEAVWREKGYMGNSAVIPQFGVDPDIYSPSAKRDRGRGFVIGSANRRLVPEKGVDLLLKAAVNLPGIWRLHIAGEGSERPSLERLARQLGIQDRVQFDGAISSTHMPAYLQQLDVSVLASRTLPTWKEQFGRILVESMACQVPVIGAESGEIPNVIGNAGLTFPEDDDAVLHQHLHNLIQSESLRETLGKAGRDRVLENYTQRQIAAQTVAAYHEMMDN